MNKWFTETFLSSMKNQQWLTEKQVAICKRYMNEDRDLNIWHIEHEFKNYTIVVYPKGYGKIFITTLPEANAQYAVRVEALDSEKVYVIGNYSNKEDAEAWIAKYSHKPIKCTLLKRNDGNSEWRLATHLK